MNLYIKIEQNWLARYLISIKNVKKITEVQPSQLRAAPEGGRPSTSAGR